MDSLVAEILELVDRVEKKVQELQDGINDILGKIPWGLGWVADKIHEAWDWFCGKMKEFWDGCTLIFGNMGDRGAVGDAVDAWSTDVGTPVSEKETVVDRALLDVDDHWEGQAAGAYWQKASLHKTAIGKVQSNFVTAAVAALNEVRAGLLKFYTGLITALGTLVVGIIGAIASTATILGAPAGPVIAGGAALVAIGAFYTGGALLKGDCEQAKSKLVAAQGDSTGFPDGAWPPGAILTA